MQADSLRIARGHWGQILSCDPSEVLVDGVTVTRWDKDSIEFLTWEGGAIIGAPERLSARLRERIERIPFDLTRDGARQIIEPLATVNGVLGPQFVGYCDRTTFEPVERDARAIDPHQLQPLRDACPGNEWTRSGIQITHQDQPTFAVLTDGQPIAASQISSAHGVEDSLWLHIPRTGTKGTGSQLSPEG